MNAPAIRVLLIDDDEHISQLVRRWLLEIRICEYELEWAADVPAGLAALERRAHDVCLLDYHIGHRTGTEVLRGAAAAQLPIPIIMLTGSLDPTVDHEAMLTGATDFLVKDQIGAASLERAIRYALARRRAEVEREQLLAKLQTALKQVKVLSGLFPLCSGCKSIRDDQGYWGELETYIHDHSGADFTHGICPDCLRAYRERTRAESQAALAATPASA